MSDKRVYFLVHETARKLAAAQCMIAENGWVCRIEPPTRSTIQNSKLWPMLSDISKQVDWYGNKLTSEEWKDVFSASLKKQKVVPGLDGGFVVCGQRTSTMSKKDFSDLLELMYAFGAEHEVKWSE